MYFIYIIYEDILDVAFEMSLKCYHRLETYHILVDTQLRRVSSNMYSSHCTFNNHIGKGKLFKLRFGLKIGILRNITISRMNAHFAKFLLIKVCNQISSRVSSADSSDDIML